jgi:SAM-dependent methyltransferase
MSTLTAGLGNGARRWPDPDEPLEPTRCPSCLRDESRLVLHGRDRLFGKPGWYRVVECDSCRLRYLNPRPTRKALERHYPPDYLPIRRLDEAPAFLRYWMRFVLRARWTMYLAMVERILGRFAPNTLVVDVGCGLNDFLVHLRKTRGCTGVGVDISAEVASFIRDRVGTPVSYGTLLDASFEAGTFDVVTMNQYLEHEPDPRAVVSEARRISRKGAHLVVEVPYASGFPARLFGSCWSQLDVPRHVAFYTPQTLGAMLGRCGYRVIHAETFGAPFSAAVSVLQALGRTQLGQLRAIDVLMLFAVGMPLLPFFPWLHEFMFVIAQAE